MNRRIHAFFSFLIIVILPLVLIITPLTTSLSFVEDDLRIEENNPNHIVHPIEQNLNDICVAFYDGDGAWEYGKVVMTSVFEWMGCNITYTRGDDIKNGCLDKFDVLYWPGGHYPAYWDEMGLEGRSKVQEFINNGGGYLGVCAGAYYACDYMVWMDDQDYPAPDYKVEGDELNLDLFPGVAYGPIFEIAERPEPGYAMTRINIINHTHPITDSLPNHMQIIYIGGPYFDPYDNAEVTILCTYNTTGTPAIAVCNYGEGRVFLIGPHAEVEEDSDRDGQEPIPELSDEGSDWPLLLEAMKWLVQAETEEVTESISLPVWTLIFFIFPLGILIIYKKYKH